MSVHLNALGQPLGAALPAWQPPPRPAHQPLGGRFCRLEPLDPARHAASLHAANQVDREGRMWTYLPYGPFADLAAYQSWMAQVTAGADPLFYAIIDLASGQALGVAAYLRIIPEAGSLELGHLAFAPALQRTPAATEALMLLFAQAFSLGYRRCEWKCNALNAPSRAAALRLGLTYEGLFRQATVVKGRNRDTAWYAVIDREWPALAAAFQRWLAPGNFDAAGQQHERLSALTAALRQSAGDL